MAPDQTATARADGEGISPADVRDDFNTALELIADSDREQSPFRALFQPPTRADILEELLAHHPEALTASEIRETGDIAKSPFYRNIDFLVEIGVVREAGKRGNAQTYAVETEHPVAQLLMMLLLVQKDGVTPMLLDEQFVGSVDEIDQDVPTE